MTPEQIIGKWAEKTSDKVAEYYAPSGVPRHYRDSAVKQHATRLMPIVEAELQPLADLIRAAQEIAEHVPRDQCLGKWIKLDDALEKLGSI